MDDQRPAANARIAGALYVAIILLGGFAEIVGRQSVVTPGDPTGTARAIMSHEAMFRLGLAAEGLTNLLAIPATIIIYQLLRPVSRSWMLIAVVFDLTQNAINAVNAVTQYAPLFLLGGSADVAALPPLQRAVLARFALHLHDAGFNIALTFFGVAVVIYGVVAIRSGFLPRFLGLIYALAGVAYLANSVLFFLAPGFGGGPLLLLVCLVGESAFALWLLIAGVDAAKWRAVVGRGGPF